MNHKVKKQIKALSESINKDYQKKLSKRQYLSVSGKVCDGKELENIILAGSEFWWTEGHYTQKFEDELKKFIGVKFMHACNSGSSANLLAFSAICSPTLGKKAVKSGAEVIVLAASFPTTVNPIIQNGCIPVFVDVMLPTYNIDVQKLEEALSRKTKAVMIAHTLGNPFEIKKVKAFCKKNHLWLIEDNCDALGSTYDGKVTGTFGDISTFSFYPAHHITCAEGGAVATDDPQLSKIIKSIRDWGRHCWCMTGQDNTCKNRFNWKLGDLPEGYDHKYIYGELGYNLKISDLHSAIGLAQIKKLKGFVKTRKSNFVYLYKKLKKLERYFILPEPTQNSDPSWFGFLLTIKDPNINRADLLKFLEENGVGTRLVFAGNITKQPYFFQNKNLKYRIAGTLENTDIVMESSFWVGIWPGLKKSDLDWIANILEKFFTNQSQNRLEVTSKIKNLIRFCPVCKNQKGKILHSQNFTTFPGSNLPNSYDVVSCESCGFVFADTKATQKVYDLFYKNQSKYENDSTGSGAGISQQDKKRLNRVVCDLIKVVGDKDADILDVGCSGGGLLFAFKQIGFKNVYGLDPSKSCVEKCHTRGLNVVYGSVFSNWSKMGLKEEKFDLIILSHVLEHIYDVDKAIEKLSSHLKDDGYLYIEVPNASQYQKNFIVPYYFFDLEHINHFDKISLKNLGRSYSLKSSRVIEKLIEMSSEHYYPALGCLFQKTSGLSRGEVKKSSLASSSVLKHVMQSKCKKDTPAILELVNSQQKVAIWGAGSNTQRLLTNSKLGECNIVVFIDNDFRKIGRTLNGVKILGPKSLIEVDYPIIITSALYAKEIKKQISDLGIKNTVINL